MDKSRNHLVFLCYGCERVFYECAYSLLSLSRVYELRQPDDTEIWIYTDKPEWFGRFGDCGLSLNFRRLNDNTLSAWRGADSFVHRVKIEALKDLTREKEGNILYADTDCVFTERVDKLFADIGCGQLYMHTMEGTISEESTPLLKKLNRYLGKGSKKLNGKPLQQMAMWNAGVLGFHTRHTHLLNEVLELTDRIYPEFPKHIVEQFAFSVCFQQKSDIQAAAPYIFHYWKLKEAEAILASYFKYFKEASWAQLTQYSELIQIQAIVQEKSDFIGKRNFLQQLTGMQWQPTKPDWARMAKTMS